MKKAIPGFKLKKHFSVYFKLYRDLEKDVELIALARPGGLRAIMLGNDELAIRYQNTRMRREILRAYLDNRNPNWYEAPYLDNAEAERRNKLYKKK